MSVENAAGWIAVIGAVASAITSIIVAIRQSKIAPKVDEIHDQVTTSNGETLAAITEGNDLRHLDPNNPPPKPAP